MNFNRGAVEIYQRHMVSGETKRIIRMIEVIVIMVMKSYSKSGKQK